ncbi:acyl-CoA dehydrogenase family protein [Microlunatus ginsengisoli]|uniref:DNA alkylation response protein n=1 Tax=Microlunatus ginsengisoli TaxID=363863 RepID=A0ABP7AR97_9ACTN
MAPTHDVVNQVPPLVDYDALAVDAALAGGLVRLGGEGVLGSLGALGRRVGDQQVQRWATEANGYPPVLRTHDRYGNRIDEVDYHPSWHRLMALSIGEGLHAAPWASGEPHAHLRRAAGFFLTSQAEAGHGCPISMTYAVLPALRHNPALTRQFEPGLTSTRYDPGLRDPAGKAGLVAGMAMTEKQGGSDVRANTTRAEPAGDGAWRLTGHKWFCSAPMSDLFLVLAQVPGAGLSCFCVPRVLPGGGRNAFALQRLKDKLGNRSNASSEVEFDGTLGWPVGEPGQGVKTILEMVTMTRLDCVIGSAAGQRAALVQAVHHARHRRVFGALLIDQPVMRAVLADLQLEVEAATALMLRLAAAVDTGERAFLRLAVAASKFWVCKRSGVVVGEALECLGGNGYVEESGLPRLFRESPLNSIWEGSGNVIALDVLRAVGRDGEAIAAVDAELASAAGSDPRFDAGVARCRELVRRPDVQQARELARLLAVLLQAAQLIRFAPAPVADLFCATRLGAPAPVLGALPAGALPRLDAVLARALP